MTLASLVRLPDPSSYDSSDERDEPFNWAAEMPRLRANVRAEVERIKAEPAP